jgi:hypothetical protein
MILERYRPSQMLLSAIAKRQLGNRGSVRTGDNTSKEFAECVKETAKAKGDIWPGGKKRACRIGSRAEGCKILDAVD